MENGDNKRRESELAETMQELESNRREVKFKIGKEERSGTYQTLTSSQIKVTEVSKFTLSLTIK